MTESVVENFAQLLSEETDDAKRAALVQRARMMAVNKAPDEAFEPPITALGDYLDTPIEIPPSVVWPTIVVRGEVTATLGRAGKGKTTMNLNRILRWSAGKPLFDSFSNKDGDTYLQPSHDLKILIIENEGAAGMFHQKVNQMLTKGNFSEDEKESVRENIYIWGDGGYSGLKLDDPAMLRKVRAGCEKVDPDIVFIEPFRSLWKGEENSSTDMANMVDCLQAIATDYSCGVILSHHERKAGAGEDGELMSGGRGSTVLEGVVACMENFQGVKGGDYKELTWSKARYLQPPPPTRFAYSFETGWYSHVSEDSIQGSVILCLRENSENAMSVKEIAEETGEKVTKLRPILAALVGDKKVKKMPSISTGEGSSGPRYRLFLSDEEDEGGLSV